MNSERVSHLLYELPAAHWLSQHVLLLPFPLSFSLFLTHSFSLSVGLIHVQNSNNAFFLPSLSFSFQETNVPFSDARCDFMFVDCCLFKPVPGYCVVIQPDFDRALERLQILMNESLGVTCLCVYSMHTTFCRVALCFHPSKHSSTLFVICFVFKPDIISTK